MTLEELEDLLPNGLHDARIRGIQHDYAHATINLEIEVLIGLPDEPRPGCDRYRAAQLQFYNAVMSSIDPPSNERILGIAGSISFNWSRIEPGTFPPNLEARIPPNALSCELYVFEWESMIRIVAGDLGFAWKA